MSTFIRGVNLSTKWLKVVILAVMVVVCATAITLGVIFSQKQNFVVQPENNNKTDVLDNNALFSANGVDEDIATRLAQNVSLYGDNVALGNAGGSIVSSVIKLGGINWTVVYKQNDILTLYANDSVAEMSFGGNSYSQSEVRDYLLNTFYPQFLQKVGYADLDSLIVPYGDNRLYYQAKGAQAVILNTLNNGVISNNDGINGDKIWIPSAYEVGGFANTEYSPRARVNSFKTINANGFTVNSGLWNTSNEMRLNADNMWLRSNVDNSIASIANGVIKGQNSGVKLSIHPCINVYMPSVCKNEVMQASANDYSSINAVLTASGVDYSSSINSSEGTSHTGTSSDKFTISKPETLCILSSAVMSGQDFSGKYFVLTKDIDMLTATGGDSITVWSPIGREGFPFKGNFSGNGFTISNLASAGSGLAGLFGYVDSATIEKIGILNSTWYTTNDYVGGVVCQANNSLISQCYSDSGVSGKQYVGGIVGQISASSAKGVQDCYNLHAVTGSQYVGGIVGNISSSLIKNCYNNGSVGSTLSTNYGGIAGGNTSGTVTNCYYYNSTGNSIGTAISSYDAVRTASTFSGFTFKNGSTSGTWFMSNVLNDRMPMLYIFMKKPTVNVKVVKGGTATVNNASTVTTTVGTTVKLIATPYADATNHYYRFAGWYFYDVDLSGNMMTTDRQPSGNWVNSTTASFSLDDYYNLEARFVRIYSVTIDSVSNGFSSSYKNSSFSYTQPNAISSVSGNWYDEGTVITIQLGSNAQCQFVSLKGGTTQANLATAINHSGTTATFTAGVTNTADKYFIRATYNRVYEIKTSVTVPSKFTSTKPVSTLSFTEAGTTTATTITSTATGTKKTVYNSPITPTAGTVTGLDFKSYTLKVGTATSSVAVTNKTAFNISTAMSTDALRPADSVTTLEFVATYTMTQITIKANTPSNGKVIISTTKGQQTSLTESSANVLTITVDYGDVYYIYAVPSYSTGYGFSTISPTVTCATATNGVVYSTATLKATTSTTYTVTFALRNAYTINFAVSGITASNVTLSNAQASGLNFASSVSGYTVKINSQALATQYFFDSVTIKIGTSTKTFTTGHTSGTYEIITNAQAIFGKMSGDKTVKGIYALSPATTAGYSNTTIDVTLNFITITRIITVQSFVSTDGGTSYKQDDSTLATYYTINTNGKGGSYALNSSVTVTANTSSSANGYKVSKIERFNASNTSEATVNPTSTAYGNSATMTFTLNENKTIKIYYIMHRYQVTIADNLNGTKDSAVAGTTVKGLGLTTAQAKNSYTYKVGTANAVNYASAFYVLYGNSLVVNATKSQFSYTDTIARKAILDSIIVKTGSNEIEYSPASSITLPDTATKGNYDNVTIVYKFILLQALNISFTDNVTGNESSALLVILVNKNDSSDTFVMILPKGSNQTIECQATDYTISAILPIFVKATTSVSGSTLEGSTLTVVNGSATTVTINVSEIIKGSQSVFGSAIF